MIKMEPLIFIDITKSLDHEQVKKTAIGASEYQFYSLINKLQHDYKITCYNKSMGSIVGNVKYKNFEKDLCVDDIHPGITIIITRHLLDFESKSYQKIKRNKMYVWWHDYVCSRDSPMSRCPFLVNYKGEKKQKYENIMDKQSFKQDILQEYTSNKNIQHIFNSNFTQKEFNGFLKNFDVYIEQGRQHVIYNAMYTELFVKRPDQSEINVNQIVYASAWTKGINIVLNVFQYICQNDPYFTLTLMSPGYEWESVQKLIPQINEIFKGRVQVIGPQNKENYSRILGTSLCTLTGRFPETFGCVFAESYYMGTPVLADVTTGAVKEIIGHENVVNFDDVKEILTRLQKMRDKRKSMNVQLKEPFTEQYILKQWKYLL